VALKDHMKRWLKRLTAVYPNLLALHDGIDDRFADVTADRLQMDANTVIAEANAEGLNRWGVDLNEVIKAGESTAQYQSMLQAIKQGLMVNQDAFVAALNRWGMAYTMFEFGDANTFWDRAFYDRSAISVPNRQVLIVFGDPFPGSTPTTAQKADANRKIQSAIQDCNRIKGRGIQIVAQIPASLS
jgi:hypothetical protein